ncbi:MAG: glucan 1,4-alpha-glucosidase [Alphaproteobacteria bacterium]|nr:glucan 1,4-alpha-glucosidase [Alphaproteobacteria bacterium]
MADNAPGWPGIQARWTSSAKSGVGRAAGGTSRVWFTLSHGILNEIYYPRIDQACTRDFGFIVTDGKAFFSEEKRDTDSSIHAIEHGVPAFVIRNRCKHHRYVLQKLVFADSQQDVLLQYVSFQALEGKASDYRLFALVAPHLVNRGDNNTAWLDDYKGTPMLFANGGGSALAVACSPAFVNRSTGFVGHSDGWQDLSRHFRMTWGYDRAENGNVALTGEVDLGRQAAFVVATGFGQQPEEAAQRAKSCLEVRAQTTLRQYVGGWRAWHKTLAALDKFEHAKGSFRTSASVLKSHEEISFPGGFIASLSIPWGNEKGDDDLGGYHLVWPRDLVEIAGGLLAAGARREARDALHYLRAIQEGDGHWPQNCWLDGRPYWAGTQMDECALPVLLLDLARREGAISDTEWHDFWPMVQKAAAYIVQNGPVTGQDRWEEDGGYSPFTLAAEISSLLAAADLAEVLGKLQQADYLRDTADAWNSQIERWTYASGTDLAKKTGVSGHYVRIAPPDVADAPSPLAGFVPIKNRPPGDDVRPVSQIVSPDALALVRFGLRAPDDPRILDTIKVIDALLKVELPAGSSWRRYNEDGYGEHEDGSPFDGTGVGRPWPLLTGERAHYELAAGRRTAAERLLAALEGFAGEGHLLPEQVWDGPDMPQRELLRGRPSGSAMPLAWAHAEHIKLLRSLCDGRIFDTPPQALKRYAMAGVASSRRMLWRSNQKCRAMEAGSILRIELPTKGLIRWTADGWATSQAVCTADSGFGLQFADLDTQRIMPGATIAFSFRSTEGGSQGEIRYDVLVR